MIYLDNAATTLQKPPRAARAVVRAMGRAGGAGRGGHEAALYSAEILYACREAAAGLFHVSDPARVIFTSNATHALNTAIKGLTPPGGHVVTSGFEHNAVVRPLHALAARGVTVEHLPTPLFEPEVALHQFEQALLRGNVSLAVCVHVSNVFGYVLPVERLAELCARHAVPLVVDASQSAGCQDIDAEATAGVYWCMPGHKGLYGPQGTGLLLLPENERLGPLLEGGTGSNSISEDMPDFPPDRLEAGTLNAHGAAGLLEGLRFIRERGLAAIRRHEIAMLALCAAALGKNRRLRLYTAPGYFCQSAVLSFTVDGLSSEAAAQKLAERGVAVRAGLHCAPLAHQAADTYPDGTVRVSVSAFTTGADIDRLAAAVRQIL